jgi:hypothetical protein
LYLGHWPARAGRKAPPDVQARYDETIAAWLANGKKLPTPASQPSVNDVILAYVTWAEKHYVPKRRKDDQNRFIKAALKVVRRAFGCAAPTAWSRWGWPVGRRSSYSRRRSSAATIQRRL